MKNKIQTITKKDIERYEKYLEKEAKKFRLTSEDLSNLTDLYYIIDDNTYNTLKINKMSKWFYDFFDRIQKITIPELYEKNEKEKGKDKRKKEKKK